MSSDLLPDDDPVNLAAITEFHATVEVFRLAGIATWAREKGHEPPVLDEVIAYLAGSSLVVRITRRAATTQHSCATRTVLWTVVGPIIGEVFDWVTDDDRPDITATEVAGVEEDSGDCAYTSTESDARVPRIDLATAVKAIRDSVGITPEPIVARIVADADAFAEEIVWAHVDPPADPWWPGKV